MIAVLVIVINNKPQFRCSGIFNSHFAINMVVSLPVKQILKFAIIWRRFVRHTKVRLFTVLLTLKTKNSPDILCMVGPIGLFSNVYIGSIKFDLPTDRLTPSATD